MSVWLNQVRRQLVIALPIVLALLAMYVLEATRISEEPKLEGGSGHADARLALFMVDSLSDRDVTERNMPRLLARLSTAGLHGPVRECSDAITVPCLQAAFTGIDRFSVFALRENFVGQRGSMVRSVLGQLQARGVSVGYFGEPLLEAPMQGLTQVRAHLNDDAKVIDAGVAALEANEVRLAIMHLTKVDTTAHAQGGDSKAYRRILRKTDERIDVAIGKLRPDTNVLVMGDHGHTTTGRHAAGLEANTYAAYLGPRFVRAEERPMPITDHAAILARVFHFFRGESPWISDYFAGRPLAKLDTLPVLSSGAHVPWWSVLLTFCLAVFVAFDLKPLVNSLRQPHTLRIQLIALAVVLNITLGATWLTMRTAIWQSSTRIVVSSIVAKIMTAFVGMGLLAWLSPLALHGHARAERIYTLLFTGALLFTLPTVYWFGGLFVPEIWLLLGLLALCIVLAWRKHWLHALGALCASLIVVSIYRVTLANYVLRNFPFYARHLAKLGTPTVAGLTALACIAALWLGLPMGKVRRRSIALSSAGFALAGAFTHVPDTWFIVPCALALPLTLLALRTQTALPWALLCMAPALWFFSEGNAVVLAPTVMVWLLVSLVSRLVEAPNPLLRAAVLLTLTWMAFWTAMGCRITGLDFDFYFRWLPKDADATSQWFTQTLMTTAKYLLPASFVMVLATHTRALNAEVLELMRALARGRLALVLVFFGAFCLATPNAGTFILGDVSQEAAFWVLILISLWLSDAAVRFEAHLAASLGPDTK